MTGYVKTDLTRTDNNDFQWIDPQGIEVIINSLMVIDLNRRYREQAINIGSRKVEVGKIKQKKDD
jgi:hypothetical protein